MTKINANDFRPPDDDNDDWWMKNIRGIRKVDDFTFTWRVHDVLRCAICQADYVAGEEGVGFLRNVVTNERIGPVCPGCLTAIVAPLETDS